MNKEYNIANVRFGSDSPKTYLYVLENIRTDPGDLLIVPVGNDGTQRIAEVVCVETTK